MSGFRHEAVLYEDGDTLLDRALTFARESVADGAAVMVAVPSPNFEALARALPAASERVRVLDMAVVGRNPARIIPAWSDFAAEHASSGRPLRGIGEPIWATRPHDELDECVRHEGLLNVAFADATDFVLLCPYNTAALPPAARAAAEATHPVVRGLDGAAAPGSFSAQALDPFAGELPSPPDVAVTLPIAGGRGIRHVRRLVSGVARAAGLPGDRRDDLLVAISELSANTVRHGDGGSFSAWYEPDRVVCDVNGGRRITDPLLGRVRPPLDSTGGRGVWLANQLCDLVQIRSNDTRTQVRVHMRTEGAPTQRRHERLVSTTKPRSR